MQVQWYSPVSPDSSWKCLGISCATQLIEIINKNVWRDDRFCRRPTYLFSTRHFAVPGGLAVKRSSGYDGDDKLFIQAVWQDAHSDTLEARFLAGLDG